MKMRKFLGILIALLAFSATSESADQGRRAAGQVPRIDVENYALEVTLVPEEHEFTAVARITFRAEEKTDTVLFDLSENLSVEQVIDPKGVEILFGQDEIGPGVLSIHFARPMEAGERTTLEVRYSGGFDRDRYSRNYARDESVAYVGAEGTYLLYPAKWLPVSNFLIDRANASVEVTVPLGLTAIGFGEQLPVVTKGITERFGWVAQKPILPLSIVAGEYFERKVQVDGVVFDCFATEEHLEAIQNIAQSVAKIVQYYRATFGEVHGGSGLRLVEVDDRVVGHHGMQGTVFITGRELASGAPSIRNLARRVAYQWWEESTGFADRGDLWLADGLAYYSAAMYLSHANGAEAFKEEIDNLAVLALKFESKSPIRNGIELGYRSEGYESVVGGKGAWVLHMLRQLVGDAKFGQLLQRYFSEASGEQPGSTAQFEALAQALYGKELRWFFAQWIDTTGIPNLQTDFVIYRTVDGFRVSGTVTQDRDLFRMPLEVEVTAGESSYRREILLDGKSTAFDVETTAMPSQVVLDPDGRILRDSQELQIAVQLSMGMDLKEKGNLVEAIRAFDNALKRNPRYSLAHFRMAEVFFEQFNLNAAADSFRNALNGDKDPPWTEVWSYIYLGKIYDILGQRQRALAEYNKALNTKDDSNGAQEEAKKWLANPYTKEASSMDVKEPR